MKNTFYFSHDYNARHDPKLLKLQAKLGMEGLGIFWCLVEMLYEQNGILPVDYDSIAFELRTEYDRIKSVILDFNLFDTDGINFWSKSVKQRLAERDEKSQKAKDSISKRWNKSPENTTVLQTQYEGNTIKERKGKESKEKEINKEKVEANASAPHSQNFQEIHDLFDPEFENKTALENTVALLIRHFGVDFDLIANFKGYLEQVKKEPYTDTNSSKIKFIITDFQNLGCPRNYYSPPKKPDKYASLDYSDEKIQAKIDYLRETTKLKDPEILDMILDGYEIPTQPPKPAFSIQIKGNMASEIEKFLNSPIA